MRCFLLRHRWCTAFVVGLLMLATSGVTVGRMTCLLGGHSIVGIGDMTDCCPEPEAGDLPGFSPVCCAYDEAGGDRTVTVISAHLDLYAVLALVDAAPVAMIAMESVHGPVGSPVSKPPPLEVPDRLALAGSYLI